jgi:hypothetical protein
MEDSQRRQMDRSLRVNEFIIARPEAFPAGSHAAELKADYQAAVTEAEEQAARQDAATLDYQEATVEKNGAINSLIEFMRGFNRTARSLNEQFPGLANQFGMPRYADQEVINRARAFVKAATPIVAEFIKLGMPVNCVTELETGITAVEAGETHQATALDNQTTATAALALALKHEAAIMREINVYIRNYFRKDPATLASWDAASKIESAPKKKKPVTSPPTP